MSDCTCEPYWQDAGGGYTELLAEPDPDCPEHFPAPKPRPPVLRGIFLGGQLYRETVINTRHWWHWEVHPDTRQLLHKGKKPRK